MSQNDFSIGSIPKLITKLALPMIGAQIINALYNIVDRMYIGRIEGIGALALAGVGLTAPVITIVTAFTNLCGMGGAPLCSIARGAGKKDEAERIMGASFALLLLLGFLLVGVFFALKAPILSFCVAGDSAEGAYAFAEEYISTYILGTPFVMISLGMNPFINSQGFTKIGMMTVLIGAVANILLDPLFIFVFGMGVRGAALATVISQMICVPWVIRFLTGKRALLRLRLSEVRFRGKILWQVVKLGFANFIMSVTESAVQLVCNRTLMRIGGAALGAQYVGIMTVISSIRSFIMLPFSGFSGGAQPVISFNYGAKRNDRVRAGIKFFGFICLGYACLVTAVIELFPSALIAIFNAELAESGARLVRIYFCMFFAMCMQMTGQSSFVALGKSGAAIFFSLLRKAFIVVPLTLILPWHTSLGALGVFIAEPISDLVGSTLCFTTFMLTVYRRLRRN